jgi:energy-coupling factor transporter ATP-binding protein EcfA2
MRFTSIEVENIFAYGGLSRIDLTGCSETQNIIVVSGRNGAGKTSLLNAIKLLFLGSSDESLRRVGFGGTPIGVKHYVLGQPGRWFGVFNNLAKPSGLPARVSMEWMDGDRTFKAQRLFRPNSGPSGFDEEVRVTINGTPQQDGEAFLLGLLPREVVPFFFFDGEQIQSIADAEIGREQGEIERLLGLSFVVHLLREIDGYAKERRRAGMPEDIRLRVIQAENAQREAEGRAEAAGRARVSVEDEILDLERQKRRLDSERNRLRTGISESDRRRMVGRIAVLQSQREALAAELADQLPAEAPWLTNPYLVQEIYRLLNEHFSGAADASLAERLHRDLPPDLIARLGAQHPPIALSDPQQVVFVRDVAAALAAAGVPADAPPANPLLASLSPRQLRMLRDQYLVWSERGAALAVGQAARLRLIRQVTSEQQQAQRDLDEAELTSEEARQRFQELTQELDDLERTHRDRSDAAAAHRVEEQRALREGAQHAEAVKGLEARYAEVSRQDKAYQMALKVRRALEDYRERRRGLIRGAVEKRLNQRVGVLLGPSELIKSVRLDDQFVMTYYDERDQEIARHSISAGMRQLVAMAMLWALKDQADRTVPVVIDTPLGRIDRENRALLMTEYFPKAGNPLVLLPTNTEFGEEGYAQVGHRVCRRYEIRNPGGDDAHIELAAGAAAQA